MTAVKGERSFTVLAELIPLIGALQENPDLAPYLTHPTNLVPDGSQWSEYKSTWLKEVIAKVIAPYGKDLVPVFACIRGITPEKYTETMSADRVISDFVDLVGDPIINDVFF